MKDMQTKVRIFWGMFFVAFIIQFITLTYIPILDEKIWVRTTELFYTRSLKLLTEPTYGYPATTLLLPASFLQTLFPFSPRLSFILSLSVLNAAAIAGIGVICFLLKPKSLWWLTASGMLMVNRLLLFATPPSALVSLLVPLILLLTLYDLRYRSQKRPLFLLGILLGASLTTRLDISLLAVFTTASLLALDATKRNFLPQLGGVVILSFCALNPYMWFMPVQHLLDIAHKITYHYEILHSEKEAMWRIFLLSPMAVGGFLVTLFFLVTKKYFTPLERQFFFRVVAFSTITIVIVLTASYRVAWYLFPIFLLWEIFLSYFLLVLLSHVSFSFIHTQAGKQIIHNVLQIFLLVLLVGGSALQLFYLYSIPTGVLPASISR